MLDSKLSSNIYHLISNLYCITNIKEVALPFQLFMGLG